MTDTHDLVLRLIVPGEPVPEGRPRFSRRGHVYTPANTAKAQERIAWEAFRLVKQMHLGKETVELGPLALTCRFYRKDGRTADLDNLVKLVKDALNKVVWKDDRQVVQLHASRIDRDKNPRTEIEVYRVQTRAIDALPE